MKAVDIQGNLNLKEQSCCKLNLKNRNERFAHFSSCCSCIRPLVKCTFDSKKSPHTHTNYLFQQIETSLFKKKTDWFYVCQTQNKQYLHTLVGSCKCRLLPHSTFQCGCCPHPHTAFFPHPHCNRTRTVQMSTNLKKNFFQFF